MTKPPPPLFHGENGRQFLVYPISAMRIMLSNSLYIKTVFSFDANIIQLQFSKIY